MHKVILILVGAAIALLSAGTVFCQHTNEHDDDDGPLHFSHPLIVESPSPDSKIRFNYGFARSRDAGEKVDDHSLEVEAEWAPRHWWSIAVTAPVVFHRPEFSPRETHTDNVEVALKFVTFHFVKQKLLPVYGVSFELPTGNSSAIGSNHIITLEPYAGLGWMKGKSEVVGFVKVGFPTNRRTTDDDGTELGYEWSYMYKPSHHVQLMLEFDGRRVMTGAGRGENVFNISPGFKYLHGHHWQFGISTGAPVTATKDFKLRTLASVFYHF